MACNRFKLILSGLTLQWGSYTYNSEAERTITFPLAFTTVYSVVLTKEGTFNNAATFLYYSVRDITNISFKTKHFNTIPTTHWIAIGIS